jgi:predicted anti-sigma-YlaC factor YlaD
MRDLDCKELVEMVTVYLDGALDEGTEARFVDHLAGCDGCERYLDQFRQTIRTLGDQGADQPAESLSDEARESLLAAFRNRKS